MSGYGTYSGHIAVPDKFIIFARQMGYIQKKSGSLYVTDERYYRSGTCHADYPRNLIR